MKTLTTAGSLRGFFREMINTLNNAKVCNICCDAKNTYEVPSKIKHCLSSVIKWKIFDYIGLFQVIRKKVNEDEVGIISYNRFLKTNKPYYIVLENPYGLVNYCDKRMLYPIAKKKITHYISDTKLKYVICMSKACFQTFDEIYNINCEKKIQIYPLIPNGVLKKAYDGAIKCLFVSSQFYLKGGDELLRALEIIGHRKNLSVTIITPVELLSNELRDRISAIGVELVDYKLSKAQIRKYYEQAHILLNPTRMESFSLVTLESMKFGCAYIGTNLYAIPEMIEEGKNGYLTDALFSPWTDGVMNSQKHKELKKYTKKGPFDDKLSMFIVEKITFLLSNIDILKSMNMYAFQKANFGEFSEENIIRKWDSIINE